MVLVRACRGRGGPLFPGSAFPRTRQTYDDAVRPHPRIRKTVMWASAAATALLLVTWIASGWCAVSWQSSGLRYRLMLQSGRVGFAEIYAQLPPRARGWHFAVQERSFAWMWARYAGRNFDARWVPLWAPTLGAVLASAIAWRVGTLGRRRARRNLCPTCGYDRSGLAAGAVCPECGSKPS